MTPKTYNKWTNKDKNIHIVVAYTKSLSDSFKTWKWSTWSKNLQWPQILGYHHTDSGVIYWYKCDRLECDEEYTSVLVRTFRERWKETLLGPFLHLWQCQHHKSSNQCGSFSIVERESHTLTMTIKEAIYYISVNEPSISRNTEDHLSHIWDEVLLKTPTPQTEIDHVQYNPVGCLCNCSHH